MGGCIPLGYDVMNRRLVVNPKEAAQVCQIFRLYLEFGCVQKLKVYLDAHGVRSKVRISKSGNKTGGAVYSRGALYKILCNRTYLGEVPHKDHSYPREHETIIERELRDKVRVRLSKSIRGHRHGANAAAPSLLRGLLYDADGNRFTPSHAVKKGMRYRYYVSQLAIEDPDTIMSTPGRISAYGFEKVVLAELKAFLESPERVSNALAESTDDLATTSRLIEWAQRAARNLNLGSNDQISESLAAIIDRIVIQTNSVEIHLRRSALRKSFFESSRIISTNQSTSVPQNEERIVLSVVMRFRKSRGEMRLIIPSPNGGPRLPKVRPVFGQGHCTCSRLGESNHCR